VVTSAEEHLAVRQRAGLFDFSFMALHEFDDAAALRALQTRDVGAMQPGQVAYTLVLEPDGAVRIDATVWRLDERRYWFFAGKPAAYGGEDRTGEFAVLALQGPASGAILARLVGAPAVAGLRYFRFARMRELLVARIGYSGELGYELLVRAEAAGALREELLEAGRPEGLRECGWPCIDSLRIEAGYVLFDREVDGRANPRELGLERLVDGAREFPLTRRLVGLELLGEGSPRDDAPAATITSECFSPTLQARIALAFVGPEVAEGSHVRASGRTARVTRLPFYDPERRRPRATPL
jgi:aminomethyltransferase